MLEVKIQPEQLEKAKQLADQLGTLNNSIMSGKGNLTGFIGEVVVADLIQAKQTNTYDSDLLWINNITIDVKTKLTAVKPLDYYECSIAAYNTKQRCDLYAFCRVNKTMDTLWFLGMIPKHTYFQEARFLRKGQVDGNNGFVVRADCYNMEIKDIWPHFTQLIGMV